MEVPRDRVADEERNRESGRASRAAHAARDGREAGVSDLVPRAATEDEELRACGTTGWGLRDVSRVQPAATPAPRCSRIRATLSATPSAEVSTTSSARE